MNNAVRSIKAAELHIRRTREAKIASRLNKPKPKHASFFKWIHKVWRVRNHGIWQDFSLEGHEYLRKPIENFMMEPRTVEKKASQMGFSEKNLAGAFFVADEYAADTIFYQPTDQLSTDFSKSRAGDSSREIPYINSNIQDTDSVALKKFKHAWIYFKGAWSSRKMRSTPADQVCLDEFDELPEGIATMAEDRLGHSNLRFIRSWSTPTFPDFGIDLAFNESNQEYYIGKCKGCSRDIVLEEDFFLEREKDWPGCIFVKKEEYWLGCVKCEAVVDLSTFRWVAKRPSEKDTVGRTITQLHSEGRNLKDFMTSYKKALNLGGKDLRRWFNGRLGLANSTGAESLTDDIIRSICENYELTSYKGDGFPKFMGIDQGDVLNIMIYDEIDDGRFRLIWAEETADKKRPYELMDQLAISFAVYDDKPERGEARRFVLQFKDRAAWCQFLNIGDAKKDYQEDVPRIAANRDEVLEQYVRMFYRGQVLWPLLSQSVMGNVLKHHKNLVTEDREDRLTGKVMKSYKKKITNHYAMAGCYAMLAARFAPARLLQFVPVYGNIYGAVSTESNVDRFKKEFSWVS